MPVSLNRMIPFFAEPLLLMRHVLFFTTCVTVLPVSPLNAQGPLERVLNATVTIKTQAGDKSGTGSGFIVSRDGIVVTAAHVIEGASAASIVTRSGEEFTVQGVLRLDNARDFAILRIAGFDLPVVEFGNSENLTVGQRVLAVGAPLGLQASVSDGLVSQVRVAEGTRLIQISAPVSPGSSGGPVVTEDGKVVGIVISGVRGGGAENLNFALPVNYVRGELALASNLTVVPLASAAATATPRPEWREGAREAMPRVNDSLAFNWSVLDGTSVLSKTKLDGPNEQLSHTSYSMSRTPSGDQRLVRTERMIIYQTADVWTGRPRTEWWRSEVSSWLTFDRDAYESIRRLDPIGYTGALPWRRETRRIKDGHLEREREGANDSFAVNIGVLPEEFVRAAVATIDSLPVGLSLWVLDVERRTVEQARVEFDLSIVTRDLRVPREGSVCEQNTRTEIRPVLAVRSRIILGADRWEGWVLAQAPHVPLGEDLVCAVVPAQGLTGR